MLKIGSINIKLQPDKNFTTFPACKKKLTWKIFIEPKDKCYNLFITRDKEKIWLGNSTCHFRASDFSFIYVNDRSFIIKSSTLFYNFFFHLHMGEWIKTNFDISKSHISQKGLYYQKEHILYYRDFETLSLTTLFKSTSRIPIYPRFFYYKKFLIFKSFGQVDFSVYINPKDSPKNIDVDILKIQNLAYEKISSKREITVNFKNCRREIASSVLDLFESNFIKTQVEDSDEIYLDLNFEDFNFNLQTLVYLNSDSRLIQDFYKQQILKLIQLKKI